MTIYQIAVLLFLFIYFGIVIGLRSYLLFQKTGINPLKQIGKTGAVGFNEKVLCIATIILPVVAFNYAFIEQNYPLLVPIEYLELAVIKNIGIAFCIIGFSLVLTAQFHMESDWRIGIDDQTENSLKVTGLFSLSRNPIYLGLMISFVGFFMIAPNVLSFCFVVIMYITLEMKIRFEESFLEKTHETVYKEYQRKGGRWI